MRTCWLCGANGSADRLDVHHIFSGPFRKKSEKYGLKVYLCHNSCHIFGPAAAHNNAYTAYLLHVYGQKKAMQEQGWSIEEFIRQFGRNYLEEDETHE